MRTDKNFRVWFSVGILSAAGGLAALLNSASFLLRSKSAPGLVRSLDGQWGSCRFAATIEFKAESRPVRFQECANVWRYQVGERVPVVYDPADPQHARTGGWNLWGPGSVFLILGLFLSAGAFFVPESDGSDKALVS